jgi:hypothetical protein
VCCNARTSTPAVTAKLNVGWMATEGKTSMKLIGELIDASVK